MKFEVGDTLEVDKSHTFFYKLGTTFTYLGVKRNFHSIRADSTGEIFDMLLTKTMDSCFKVVNFNLENE